MAAPVSTSVVLISSAGSTDGTAVGVGATSTASAQPASITAPTKTAAPASARKHFPMSTLPAIGISVSERALRVQMLPRA